MVHRDVDVPPDAKTALDALALLSGKWQPAVLAVLAHHGPAGFNDLLESIPGVSGKVLTETLDALQEAELVERTIVNEAPLRVEYELTVAGEGIEGVFEELAAWGEEYLDAVNPTVLVVDSDRRLTEMYSRWLEERYTVVRAHSDEELDRRCKEEIDVMLFAEGVPGTDPERILAAVRPECRTIMLVEERTDFDVLEIGCDELLRKPVVSERLREAVEEQLTRQGESDPQREFGSLGAKQSFLESIHPSETLAANDDYRELCSRLETLEAQLDD